jgi:hypothetical protein
VECILGDSPVETHVIKGRNCSVEGRALDGPEFHVPGIEQVIQLLQREFPQLSEIAIARILGLPIQNFHAFELKRQTGKPCRPDNAGEISK